MGDRMESKTEKLGADWCTLKLWGLCVGKIYVI